jgi:hypothetical protein
MAKSHNKHSQPRTQAMKPEEQTRPKWDIDRLLENLVGQDIRVAARAFLPPRQDHNLAGRFRLVRDLYLPDNTRPAGLPVIFEGRLQQFERRIGVVFVGLESSVASERASEGKAFFRGGIAVVLHGPAIVELEFPFHVERLPTDGDNYWRDLRNRRTQFEFPLPAACGHDDGSAVSQRPQNTGGKS